MKSIQAQAPTSHKMSGWRELGQVRAEAEAPLVWGFMCDPCSSCAGQRSWHSHICKNVCSKCKNTSVPYFIQDLCTGHRQHSEKGNYP